MQQTHSAPKPSLQSYIKTLHKQQYPLGTDLLWGHVTPYHPPRMSLVSKGFCSAEKTRYGSIVSTRRLYWKFLALNS